VLNRRFSLGTYLGIGLYVHWTFSLLLLAVAIDRISRGSGWQEVLLSLAIVLTMYLCVTLHEYGHAMMARCFGVGTRDITLLPIGGVARLEHMPRVPWQEFLIAVAGPAVNVVIAMLLASVLLVLGIVSSDFLQSAEQSMQDVETGSLSVPGFVLVILIANIALVVFNMIPAFPMDGGRVLRSLLAMMMNYRRATWVASRIGLVCAMFMAAFAYSNSFYVLLLISCFIAWAGMMEAKQVAVTESVRGLRVADSMIHMDGVAMVSAEQTLGELARLWQRSAETVLPVADATGQLIGMVHLQDLAKAMRNQQHGTTWEQPVAALARCDLPTLYPEQRIEDILTNPPHRRMRQLPVVSYGGQFLGMLDLDSLLDRSSLSHAIDRVMPPPTLPADRSDIDPPRDADEGTLFTA